MTLQSDEREVAQTIETLFSLKVSVTSKPIGNSFMLVITLPKETEEQTIENIAEVLDNDGWSFTLRREGDVN